MEEIKKLIENQSYSKAIEECKKELKISPSLTKSHMLGYLYYLNKDYQFAIDTLTDIQDDTSEEKKEELLSIIAQSYLFFIPIREAKCEFS